MELFTAFSLPYLAKNFSRKKKNSRKSVGIRTEPWKTPVVTGYSCEDFPSRTTQYCLLLRKNKIRVNNWPEIPEDLILWTRPVCQTLSKVLDISSTRAWVAPDLLKVLTILSAATVRRTAIDQEDLKPYWKSEKDNIFLVDQQAYHLQVFQRLY